MPDDAPPTGSSSSSSTVAARPKTSRTSQSGGTVRGRTSPGPGNGDNNGDARPQKRARKAINCEPCRNSKLKCDRNRPCSSCVLRGTAALCYQDSRPPEGADANVRGDDHHYTRIDPAQEIARMRHSINLLEAYVLPHTRSAQLIHHPPPRPARTNEVNNFTPKKEPFDPDVNDKQTNDAPGMLGSQTQGGLYAGPTSAALHLLSNEASRGSDDEDSRQQSQERIEEFPPSGNVEYDRELLGMLPSLDVIDGLISYYFEYCNWVYRHVNQPAFSQNWERFKSGQSADRITLATACTIMAIATHYLPAGHSLLEGFSETQEQMGQTFFEVSKLSLERRRQETKAYTLDLVELRLIQVHYQVLLKTDSEEIWAGRGELVTIGTAMGLHRDPGKWRMPRDVAERRRWAWWHIILLERWQAFMFGRPLTIASHHFDTQLPSYCDPAIDKTGRLYLPNIALFRLAYLLGDVVDDAVSVRPVPYESVQANDRALTEWMDNLPPELDLDEYRVARNLASPNANLRRLGVQSVIIRTSYYHIRFSLHRPYASLPSHGKSSSSTPSKPPAGPPSAAEQSRQAQSLEIAVSAADKLITMVSQARPDFMANSSLAVPGHMNWGPWHCFSAAMFFSFQLIANPDQPGAGLFRASIRKAMSTLEQSRGMSVSDKGLDILNALAPLYSAEFMMKNQEEREKERVKVLSVVRKLAFPYHDSHDPRRWMTGNTDSPGSGVGGRMALLGAGSPANSTSVSPPVGQLVATLSHSQSHYDTLQTHAMSSIRTSPVYSGNGTTSTSSGGTQNQSPHSLNPQVSSPTGMHHPAGSLGGIQSSTPYSQGYPMMTQQQSMYDGGGHPTSQYVHHVDEASMWGAAVGFGQTEWSQFLDGTFKSMPPAVVSHRMQG
ncbi:nucleus protein [Moniliophthora roreri MCA 2997]|uniref:Nucleus protein n=1 Tax=Moniliophthora roreri (strain MCA 2997) TaxID=1381753 RepID=V2XIN4_MONRO|nr:nucleus protein [Moniliophthora roreri MCA 2997]